MAAATIAQTPGHSYNNPVGGTASTIGKQFNTQFWIKKALVEAQKEQYFTQTADVTAMPKHYGKKLVRYHYMPLLDDRNTNDQGIDASGAKISNGNLYGSSKDVGTISSKLPALTEQGGRVNRVGFKRLEIEGTFSKFGFFNEFTQESLDFDTDDELLAHLNREAILGANEMTEDALQIDLLNAAGVVRFGGEATADGEVTGEGTDKTKWSLVDYEDLMRLSIDLDNNRCPKSTTIITGSRMIDTRTINSARVLYIGSELIPTIRKMKDSFDNQAFIPVQHYAAAGTVLRGEIGTIDQFRIVVVPEMQHWAGSGKAETSANAGFRATNSKYDIFPMLCVGSASFTTIGFQTDGKTVKFKITTKMPGRETADRTDPYGETGFSSIKWYYGSMVLRPERIALVKTIAEV